MFSSVSGWIYLEAGALPSQSIDGTVILEPFQVSLHRIVNLMGRLAVHFVGLALFIGISSPSWAAPNILLMLADDMACQDCQPYGNPEVRTPHLKRLAKEGLVFDRAFTATAMCAPTRQQLYTGVFPVRNGAYPNHSQVMPGTRSIVHHLRELGYRVGLLGKTHFGPPDSFPFEKLTKRSSREFVSRDVNQPFCLVVASNSPHLPWKAGPQDYDADSLTIPDYLVDNAETRAALARYYSEISDFDREVGHWLGILDEQGLAHNTIAIVSSEQGPQFPGGKWTCYDYGLRVALFVRWPKVVEPGTRTQAMVQYVDILPTLLEAVGADPTKVDTGLPGAKDGGSGFDGRSFMGVLSGQAKTHGQWTYGVHTTQGIIAGRPYPIRSIRDERYKYIINLLPDSNFHNTVIESDRANYWRSWERDAKHDDHAKRLVQRYIRRPAEELYDLQTDPNELHNLAADSRYQARVETMKQQLTRWMKQQNDRGIETELAANQRKRRRQQ